MKSRDTISDVSTRIRGLMGYGMREVTSAAPGYKIVWRNSNATWGRSRSVSNGEKIRLDSNETIAYVTAKELDNMLAALPDLPLYGNSFEASSGRGRTPKPDMESRCNCNLKASDIPDSHFDPYELKLGIVDEMEHTTMPAIAKAIAKGHLVKNPKYYSESKRKHCP
jgi:hypothetical protein